MLIMVNSVEINIYLSILFITTGSVFLFASYWYKLLQDSQLVVVDADNNVNISYRINHHDVYKKVNYITLFIIICELISIVLLSNLASYHLWNMGFVVFLVILLQYMHYIYVEPDQNKMILDLLGNINLFVISYICSSLYGECTGPIRYSYIFLGYACILLSIYRIFFFRSNNSLVNKKLSQVISRTIKSYFHFVLTFLCACNYCMEVSCYGQSNIMNSGFAIEHSSGNFFLDLFVYIVSTSMTVGNAGVSPRSSFARLLNFILIMIGPIAIGVFMNEMAKLKKDAPSS